MDTLGLVETIHARSEGIIVGICNGPDRGSGADLVEALGETNRRELRTGVAVCDEPNESFRPSRSSHHLESVEDHLGPHVRRNGPADDAPRERINDETHVGHPRTSWNVGEVRDPQCVGLLSSVCVRLRPCSSSPTAPSTPASSPRREQREATVTARGVWLCDMWMERTATRCRSARLRTRHDDHR